MNTATRDRAARHRTALGFLFLNVGHFFDHFLMLVFATVAALHLSQAWGLSYAELIPYATPGFVAFGLFAIPAGWLADKWSRERMMCIFFLGAGIAAMGTAVATTPVHIGIGLFIIGVFAAIYHPVGLPMVIQGRQRTGVVLAINGVWGNLGVACAALVTGFVMDVAGWRWAFVVPGMLCFACGIAYAWFLSQPAAADDEARVAAAGKPKSTPSDLPVGLLVRILLVVFFTTALGGLIFQSTTFALPKVFDERLTDLASSATGVGGYAFVVFALAAGGQLVVGYLLDRRRLRSVFLVVAAMQSLLFFVMQQLSGPMALLVSIGFMLVVFGQIPINDVLLGRITRSEWRSRMFACRYVVTLSVMASAVPLIAWVHATWGFERLFIVLGVAASLVFAAVLSLPRELGEPKPQT